MKSVLVTGADGLVGKRLIAKLVKEGISVSAFVRTDREKSNFESQNVKCFIGKSQDSNLVEEAVKGQEALIHLIGTFDPENGSSLDQVNNLSTYNFHTAASENNVKKFIFLSTHGASLGVQNAFLVSKGNAEVDIMQGEVPYVILRSAPIYGPESVFTTLINQLIDKKKVPLIGSGQQKFQPIYVDDVVEYLYQALIDPKARQQVLEIGGPDKISYEDLIQCASQIKGKEIQFAKVPSFLRSFMSPITLNGSELSKERLDFYSRDSFVNMERAQSIIPIQLTPLQEGLKKSLKNLID